MNGADQLPDRSDRGVYVTSMLWAVPLCFVLTIVATAATLALGQLGEPDFDALGAVFSGIFLGALLFFPTCLVSVPLVGLSIASIRLVVNGRQWKKTHR